jgi:DNA-binding GntR family transcriptional regulator
LQELSSEYGMSLIPIREALRRLEVERLVENRPNRGARVAPMSLADVDDAYNSRILLESEALRRAWPNIDAATVAHARRDMDDMFAAFEEKRLRDGAQLHEKHHFDLWVRAGSEWLDHLIRILWGHTERYRNLALALQTPSPGEAEYHVLVMGAIERWDLDAAIRHTEEELGRARDVVIEHLSKAIKLEPTSESA